MPQFHFEHMICRKKSTGFQKDAPAPPARRTRSMTVAAAVQKENNDEQGGMTVDAAAKAKVVSDQQGGMTVDAAAVAEEMNDGQHSSEDVKVVGVCKSPGRPRRGEGKKRKDVSDLNKCTSGMLSSRDVEFYME